jgi:Uma2 family endonuclease
MLNNGFTKPGERHDYQCCCREQHERLTTTRGPDVAFIEKNRLPGGGFPRQAYPALAPNLVGEVLSPGNTKAEMARKRLEYFHAGVES